MSVQTSIKIDPKKVHEFRGFLLKNKEVRPRPTLGKYEAFRAEYRDSVIVGYTSGSIVYQRDEKVQELIERGLYEVLSLETKIVVGSDEAGKGEWLGPLVVATVALEPPQFVALQALGVMDSKRLSEQRVKGLAEKIEREIDVKKVMTIMPKKFNELWASLKREGKSLNDMLAWMHARAIEDVLEQIEKRYEGAPVEVVVDEFCRKKLESRLSRVRVGRKVKVTQRFKAEANTAVAAASILAKATREKKIDEMSRRYGLDLRGLSVVDAKKLAFFADIAKVGYIA